MEGDRTSERDLIIPALEVLLISDGNRYLVETRVLTRELRKRIKPTLADKEMLKGRNDDRLSQVIRNLVSHRTLEKQGLAIYQIDKINKQKGYQLTKKGIEMLRQNKKESEQEEPNFGQLRLPLEDY